MRGSQPRWLGAAVGVFVLSNLMGSWLWGRLLKMQDVDISFPRLAAYYFVGLFFNNFLPANIAGDFARISAAKEHTNRSAAVFSATVERTTSPRLLRVVESTARSASVVVSTRPMPS